MRAYHKLSWPVEAAELVAPCADVDRAASARIKTEAEAQSQGLVFMTLQEGLKAHPRLIEKHLGSVVAVDFDKAAALNMAGWSDGIVIYVPRGLEVSLPLQADLGTGGGAFQRTLIVADEGSSVHYLEGCSAPVGSPAALQAPVVELRALPGARIRFTTLQDWPRRVVNLAVKRARADAGASIDWVDANLGSRLTVKRPGVVLAGKGARGRVRSFGFAGAGQRLELGAEFIVEAPETEAELDLRCVAMDGGEVSSGVMVQGRAVRAQVKSEAFLLDEASRFHAETAQGVVAQSRTSRPTADQLSYLMTRGFDRRQAVALLAGGFLAPFARELPLEYSVEFLRLVDLALEPEPS
ncbi:MAG: SufD family Fe-S cluster assembly protein [Elusimicrobiota bacterium]